MRSLSPEDLEAAKSFLSKLAVQDGTVVTDPSLIFTLDGSGAIETALDCNDASTAEVIVKTVEALRNAFSFLESVALDGLAHIGNKISAFGKGYAGIDSLPDEILGDILSRVRAQGFSIDPLLRTSRSVRKQVTRLPELWTNVSTEKNPMNHLEWSKPRKLAVSVRANSLYGILLEQELDHKTKELHRAKKFLSLLGPHSSRWKSFIFRDRIDEVCLMQILAAESFPKIFPNLEYLVLAYKEHESLELEQLLNSDDAAKDFISHWKMPALDYLELKNFIPSRIQGSPTSFEFDLSIDESLREWNLTRLTTLLNSFKLLKQLSISLMTMFDGRHEGPPALLENLETLDLIVDGGAADFLLAVLASFEAPNVKDLSIDVVTEHGEDEIPIILALLPNDKLRWPKASSLDIQLYSYPVDDDLGLNIALKRLPMLNHLIVRSTYYHVNDQILPQAYQTPRLAVHPSLRGNQSSFPPLRSLTLIRCPFNVAFFMIHADIFNCSKFRRMEIQECGNIDALVLRGLLQVDKILSYDEKRILPLMT